MQVYMEGCDYWEAAEDDYDVAALPDNPTLNQIRHHKEMKTIKAKAKACLYAAVSPAISSIIMACDSAKKIWDFLKAEYKGDEKIKSMKGLNLVKEFEGLQMKEFEIIKEYSTKLVDIANKARMLGTDLSNNRLVQKILVSLPERYEATIASLENTKNLSQIKLVELVSVLQEPEQRRSMRLKGSVEEALRAKVQQNSEGKEKKWKGKKRSDSNAEVVVGEGSAGNKGGRYSPCKHCGKQNHPHFRCWRRSDVRCKRCQKMGHIEKFFKEKGDQQQGKAHVVVQQEVDQLFVPSCFISSTLCNCWLVDSSCTNHMTSDEKLFRNLDKSIKSRVRIEDGQHLAVEGL